MFYFALAIGNAEEKESGIVIGNPDLESYGAYGCFDDLDAAENFIRAAFVKYAECLTPLAIADEDELNLHGNLPEELEYKAFYLDVPVDMYGLDSDIDEAFRKAKLAGIILKVTTPWTVWS